MASGATGTITNRVSAETTTEDANPEPSAEVTHNLTPRADLSIVKSDLAAGGEVLDGGHATFALLVSNAGPSDAAAPVVTDTLPKGLTYVSATGAPCKAAGQIVTCDLGPGALAAGSSVTIDVTVAAGEPGHLVNQAEVQSPTEDPKPEDNSSQAPITVVPAADLSIVKTATGETVAVPGSTTYGLLVRNAGPDPAQNVEVVDDLPAGETYAGSEAGCSAAGQIVTCLLGEMAVGGSRQLQLEVSLAGSLAGQTVENAAAVKSSTRDPEEANNRSTAPIHTGESADVAIVKRGPASVVTGQRIHWTLAAANHGPSTATGVTVTDRLPADTSYVSAKASQGSCSYTAPTVTCALGTMADGAGASVTLTALVKAPPGALTNTASISAGQPDPEVADNSSTAVTMVLAQPKVTLRKLVRQGSIAPGGELDYRLIVRDGGPGVAEHLSVCDILPGRTTLVSRGTGRLAGGRVCFTLAALRAGASRSFSLVLRADPTARQRVVNHATVTGSNFSEARAQATTVLSEQGVGAFRVQGVTG